jgi:hypothetical protein
MKVDAWFSDFLSAIRLTSSQITELKDGHTRLTERIKADEELSPLIVSTFLQGSYRRATAVRPHGEKRADVDIIVVTNLREEDYPDPEKAMKLFVPLMERHYRGKYELQGRSIGISMSKVDLDVVLTSAPSEADEKVLKSESARSTATLEEARDWRLTGSWVSPEHRTSASAQKVVEAAQREAEWQTEPLRIPDREAKQWDDTHPLEQNRWTREKNRVTEGNYVNVVKALKWWRVEKLTDMKYPKGYPIEHMIGDCCPDGVTSMAECVTLTLEEIVKRYQADALASRTPVLPDRGVPAHNVWCRLTGTEFTTFYDHVVEAAAIARAALDAEDLADQVEAWQQLFGNKFPDPPQRGRGEQNSGGGPGGTGGFTKRTAPGVIGGGRFG